MIEPLQIIEESDSLLTIAWSDSTTSSYRAAELRRTCPCAGCVNEWTGNKILDAAAVPDDLTISSISIVGRYALNFHFSDGHETGIFSFRMLHAMSQKN